MITSTMRRATPIATLLALAACHADGLSNHNCPTTYRGGWRVYGFDLEHQEPRRCPVFLSQPQVLRTGATIVDGGISRDANEAFLVVFNGVGQAKTSGKTVIFGMRESDRNWIAPIYEDYSAGTGGHLLPDLAKFDVYADNTLLADADMQITYTDALQASIDGPVYTQDGHSYMWTASISQGVPPYTYRWYDDWELISTDATISRAGANMHLRLDVTDSRGHAVSSELMVDVRECTGSEVEC